MGEPGRFLRIYEDDNLETFILEDVPQAEWDSARQGYAGEYVSGPAPITYYIGFDVPRLPFDDPRVRRAFTLVTDKEMLADVALRGHAFPATGGLVPPGMAGHSPGIGLPYDPEDARDQRVRRPCAEAAGLNEVRCTRCKWRWTRPAPASSNTPMAAKDAVTSRSPGASAPDRLTVILHDYGRPFDPTGVSPPDLEASLEDRNTRGLGFYFMRRLMDAVKFEFTSDCGNMLTMVKFKEAAP